MSTVDQQLVDAAIDLVRTRFGGKAWSGAAALRLADGTILTSTSPEPPNVAVTLCHETGAICEAFKRDQPVVASVCVVAADQDRGYWILTPCGVCQERLIAYGPDVAVGVPDFADPRRWRSMRLRDVQPHWFGRAFPEDGIWPHETGLPGHADGANEPTHRVPVAPSGGGRGDPLAPSARCRRPVGRALGRPSRGAPTWGPGNGAGRVHTGR